MSITLSDIPSDIIRNNIIPYTYLPQSPALLKDIQSYYQTNKHVREVYSKLFPVKSTTIKDDCDEAWLSNDICRFLNNDVPTMYGFVDFYISVYKRLYMNTKRNSDDIWIPDILDSYNFNDINISIGLLTIEERKNLITFLTGSI